MPGPSTNETFGWNDVRETIESEGRRRMPVYRPSGFTWIPPINIYKDERGRVYTDFDVSIYQPTGAAYYVDVVNGLDTNDGLTRATAFKTIKKATDTVAAVVIWVAEGIYNRVDAFANTAVTKSGSIAIKAMPGHNVRIVNCSPQVWVRHAAYTNLFSSSVANSPMTTSAVYDDLYHDENGDMLLYQMVANPQIANTTPGTYFLSGSTVFVHPIDDRIPDSSIIAMKEQMSAQFNDGTFYFEGISFEGGSNGACHIEKIAAAPKAYFKNCKFKYSVNDVGSPGGLTVIGASEVFLQNCEAARNLNDGFNYHVKTGTIANVIEVNCVGRHNGQLQDIDNGSTMHDGGKIVRVLGEYFGNSGSNVGDNHPNTQAWNIGCYAHDSTARNIGNYRSNFTAHSDSEMWLDTCRSDNSMHALLVQINATMYVRNCDLRGEETLEDNGKRFTY